jgi:DNA-directed RNA polymerase specialized sigma24 family protein
MSPREMASIDGDAALVARVIAGDEAAWRAFKTRARDVLYRTALRYFDDPLAAAEARNLLIDLTAEGCAALRRYKGGALATFVALAADVAMGARLSALFASDPAVAWPGFERRFRDEIRARIRRQFRLAPGQILPSGRELEDLYNDFTVHLISKAYQPLIAYSGGGQASFSWFLMNRVLANWCRDEHRREYARWRPPEAVKRLPALAQHVFELMDRDRLSAAEVAARLPHEDPATLEDAIEAVFRACAPGGRGRPVKESLVQTDPEGGVREMPLPDEGVSPEEALLETERGVQAARAIAALADDERLVLVLWLEHEDMSRVAALCGRTVADARRVKERALRKAQRLVESGEAPAGAETPELVRLFSPRSA